MTLRHQAVVIDGERVGDLVTLGMQVVFYTTDPALADLDGQKYPDFDRAVIAIRAVLKAAKLAA